MAKRHNSFGVKQTLKLEWLQKTADMLLAGMDTKSIRRELHKFMLSEKCRHGERSKSSRYFAVANLMKIWILPDPELLPFRDDALAYLAANLDMALPAHWAMISAVYPFWHSVARQCGRLLALQREITQSQIITRLKEQYGDRQTISRIAQYIIRSFVEWGVLRDTQVTGCYKKGEQIEIGPELAILMLESALLAVPEGRGYLHSVLNNPAFFAFNLPMIIDAASLNKRMEAVNCGSNDCLLILKA